MLAKGKTLKSLKKIQRNVRVVKHFGPWVSVPSKVWGFNDIVLSAY